MIHTRSSTRRTLVRFGLGLLLGTILTGVAPAARAQLPPPDPERLRLELENTDRMLERAGEIVRQAGNPRALQELEIAVHLQEAAWGEFKAMHPLRALRNTQEARAHARRAIELSSQEGGNAEQRAQRAIENAERALERARECAGNPPPVPVQRLFSVAAERLQRAREALHERRFRIAADIAIEVERMLHPICDRRPGRSVETLIESVRRLIADHGPDIEASNDRVAISMLEQAGRELRGAEELLQAGNPLMAERRAKFAQDLVLRAMRRTEKQPDVANVDRVLEDTASYVDDVARQVRTLGNVEATTLVERAIEHLQRARELRQHDRLRQALAEASVARNLARRAGQLAGIKQM